MKHIVVKPKLTSALILDIIMDTVIENSKRGYTAHKKHRFERFTYSNEIRMRLYTQYKIHAAFPAIRKLCNGLVKAELIFVRREKGHQTQYSTMVYPGYTAEGNYFVQL